MNLTVFASAWKIREMSLFCAVCFALVHTCALLWCTRRAACKACRVSWCVALGTAGTRGCAGGLLTLGRKVHSVASGSLHRLDVFSAS